MEMRMKRLLIAAAALALGMGAAVAGTDDHKFDKNQPPGFKQGNKTGWDNGDHPPGWDQGKKEGWDKEDRPPGLAKKDDHKDDYNDNDHKDN
jgi:hypothetical protein